MDTTARPFSPFVRWSAAGFLFLTAAAARGQTLASSRNSRWSTAAELRIEDGHLVGPWRHRARPLIACYEGSFTQSHPTFREASRRLARQIGGEAVILTPAQVRPSSEDENGALLFPDGAPRLLLLIMPGGNAAWAMAELAGVSEPKRVEAMLAEREKFMVARALARQAFDNGMNYLGVCGGFFIAASGYRVPEKVQVGWGLWPGKIGNIGPPRTPPFPDVIFDAPEAAHPLVQRWGVRLENMEFNGGPIGIEEGVADTEYVGRYRGTQSRALDGERFLIAYQPKNRPHSGRCVLVTGHPELRHPEALLAMAWYAMDHEVAMPCRRLMIGEVIEATIGDDQLHFYRLRPPTGGLVRVALAGLTARVNLYWRKNLPPTPWRYDRAVSNVQALHPILEFEANPQTDYFLAVHGAHDRLNGVRYVLAVGGGGVRP